MKPFRENRRGEKFKAGDTILVLKETKKQRRRAGRKPNDSSAVKILNGRRIQPSNRKATRYKPFIEKIVGVW